MHVVRRVPIRQCLQRCALRIRPNLKHVKMISDIENNVQSKPATRLSLTETQHVRYRLKAQLEQEQSETAYVRRGEYGLDPDSESGLLPKFYGYFLVQGYICDEIFMKIRSLSPEI